MKRRERALLVALTAIAVSVGIFARWSNLDFHSLWWDELFTMEDANYPWRYLGTIQLWRATHPPLFVLLTKGWLFLFGDNESAVRSMTALIGTVAILSTALLAWVFVGMEAALFSTILFSLSHFAIYYSQEFYLYILFLLLSSTSLALSGFWVGARVVRPWQFWTLLLVNTLLLFTHYYALLVILFEGVLYLCTSQTKGDPKTNRYWWLAQSIPFALFSFWLPGLAFHAFHLPQHHLQKHVAIEDLLMKISPGGASFSVPGHRTFAIIVCIAFFVLFCVGSFRAISSSIRSRFFNLTWHKPEKGRVRELLTTMLLIYLWGGVLGAVFSPWVFAPWRNGPFQGPISFECLALEGVSIYTISFLSIGFGSYCSLCVRSGPKESSASSPRERFPISLLCFALFIMMITELAGLLFRPTYELRNLIITLPAFYAIAAYGLKVSQNQNLKALALLAGMVLLLPIISDARFLRPRVDYRGLADQIRTIASERGISLATATGSDLAELPLRYYLRGVTNIYCNMDCKEKLGGLSNVVWVWHTDPKYEDQKNFSIVKKMSERGKTNLTLEAAGLIAKWVTY